MPDFVRGLELAGLFYAEVVRPLLGGRAHVAARIGPGSDVLGFDTERSTDHGWGPRVHVFVVASDVEATRIAVDAGLPEMFRGWPVRFGWDAVATRHHVQISTLTSWIEDQLGFDPQEGIAIAQWLAIPQQLLLEVTAGTVFHDPDRVLGRLREKLAWYPDDVWLWLMASQWRRIGQEEAFVGRTAEVGDELGSRIVAARLVRDLMRLCFLQERRYAPYGKWLGTAFRGLPTAAELRPHLEAALAASEHPAREAALCRAYEIVARRHNELALTAVVDPTVRDFYDRPFRVLGADRVADASVERIGDEGLKHRPLIGGIDQLVDNTDLLSYARRAQGTTAIYDAD